MGQTRIDVPPARRAAVAAMTTEELKGSFVASFGPPVEVAGLRHGEPSEPELLVEEVEAPGTARRCDLLRVGIWPSRGHRIAVYELKVSRADWLRELADPAKAEAWWKYCHEFWIVAPVGVVDPAELPEGWGLLVPPKPGGRAKKFRAVVPAAVREAEITPGLLAAIVRRTDNARRNQIAALNRERQAMVAAEVEKRSRLRVPNIEPKVQRRLKVLKQLEAALGFPLDGCWGGADTPLASAAPEEVAEALREYTPDHIALQRRGRELHRQADLLARRAARVVEACGEVTGANPGRGEEER